DPILANLERRHRWAIAGSVEDSGRRHALTLELDGRFEDLRQLLRSIRILREATPRAADAILSYGEDLSVKIVCAAMADRGLDVVSVDPRDVIRTDANFGAATPDPVAVGRACERVLGSLLSAARVPVLGGFVGSTESGETTTLGRGGSDMSAAVIGQALAAEEIQIWTDVDGLMSADPGLVPAARTLERVGFAEAAELAHFGARVLHPSTIAPAVSSDIPVRVLNSFRPEGAGTVIVGNASQAGFSEPIAVASRDGVCLVRVRSPSMALEPGFLARLFEVLRPVALRPDLVVASEASVAMVAPDDFEPSTIRALTEQAGCELSIEKDRSVVCVVGAVLAEQNELRAKVAAELARWQPDLLAFGASRSGVTAALDCASLAQALRRLHRVFVEEE
ncbi:MAG: aspartate kinase, partial [Phycisphaeraceae bacterium]|nr:aspartate kinase [Phycisphaeraceae bacterium]